MMLEHRAIPEHVLDPAHRELWAKACEILERNFRVMEGLTKEDPDVQSSNGGEVSATSPDTEEEAA